MLIDAADLDGDGVDEIVVPHYLKDDFRLSILRRSRPGSADAWVEHAIRYPAIAGRPKAAAIGDIDLDGKRDLVLSCEQASNGKRGIVWLRSRGSPLQADWDVFDVSGPEGIKFDLNLLLDVDADGTRVINSEENDTAPTASPAWRRVYEKPDSGTRRELPPIILEERIPYPAVNTPVDGRTLNSRRIRMFTQPCTVFGGMMMMSPTFTSRITTSGPITGPLHDGPLSSRVTAESGAERRPLTMRPPVTIVPPPDTM